MDRRTKEDNLVTNIAFLGTVVLKVLFSKYSTKSRTLQKCGIIHLPSAPLPAAPLPPWLRRPPPSPA